MTSIEYTRGLRRRWPIVAAAIIAAVLGAWLVPSPRHEAAPRPTYKATEIMLQSDTSGFGDRSVPPAITNLTTIAALVTVGDVPARAARTLHGNSHELAGEVSASVDANTGFLNITSSSTSAKKAEQVVSAFSDALLASLKERSAAGLRAQVRSLNVQIRDLRRQIADLDRRIKGAKGINQNILTSERAAKFQSLQQLQDQRKSLLEGVPSSGLDVIQPAVARPQPISTSSSRFALPKSRWARIGVAIVVGLLLGIAIALLAERLDTRLRTRTGVEESFGLPVLAEIPPLPRKMRRRLAMAVPKSASANAFRLLATSVADPAMGNGAGARGNGQRSGRTIMVTSPGPSEGKTTVTANLAAALAEQGNKVMVLSCDFRRPSIHQFMEVANVPGLSDALSSGNGSRIVYIKPLPNKSHSGLVYNPRWDIEVVSSGSSVDRPDELLSSERLQQVLDGAVQQADVVLLDTAPLLTATESMLLLPKVDQVIVVARSGKTTIDVARRTSELLKRLDAPVKGIALNKAERTSSAR